MLVDGTYDTFVVDAHEQVGDDGEPSMLLELTVTTGEHKGEVVTIAARGLPGTEIDLLGMPATLTVADGTPTVRIDT